MSDYLYGVITVSDRCNAGQAVDESGPTLKTLLQNNFNAVKVTQSTVPDEQDQIEKTLKYYCDELKVDLLITTGGTGFAPRDVTPEATKNVIHRECPNLSIAMSLESFKKTPFAALSRAVCGIRNKTLVVNMPGSKKAVLECFDAIQPVLLHAIQLMCDEKSKSEKTHQQLQKKFVQPIKKVQPVPTTPFNKGSDTSLSISDILQLSSAMNEIILDEEILTGKSERISKPVASSSSSAPDIAIPEITGATKKITKPTSSFSGSNSSDIVLPEKTHVCPHKTKSDDPGDRNSPFPMVEVADALKKIYSKVQVINETVTVNSPMNCPPFRASIKDGYAMKSCSVAIVRKVIGNISAGEPALTEDFDDDECYKINTGAAVPVYADAIVQVEDTRVHSIYRDGKEKEIYLLKIPKKNVDIREIGSDLAKGEPLFKISGLMETAQKTFLASVGMTMPQKKPTIAIISTGDELVEPGNELKEGQIYDANSTMIKMLLTKYNFECHFSEIAKDDYVSLKKVVTKALSKCDVIISSGGVSMGDKDFVKPLLMELDFDIQFGRVNMKPGKPMTFACNNAGKYYFALPGNPVSAFVTFHVFVLPALRYMCGYPLAKCSLPTITTILKMDKYILDPRPEFARAQICFDTKKNLFYAQITSSQMSSCINSLINADVMLHLPASTEKMTSINCGFKLKAYIIDPFFISSLQE